MPHRPAKERSLHDRRGYRVGQTQQTGSLTVDLSQSTWTTTEEFEYLASHSNHTGYAQTLRTWEYNASGELVKQIDYTFGHDEIAQRTREFDPFGAVATDHTLVLGHDGHGSVRVLYNLAEAVESIIEQVITYSAFGSVIATHTGDGTFAGYGGGAPITSLQYSGEAWDAALNRGYNRARWYNPATAQWNRLDPYSGNMQDPQSLHKYAYVHGDPVMGTDPKGLSLISSFASFSIRMTIRMVRSNAIALARVGAIASLIYGFNALTQRPADIPFELLVKAMDYGVLAASVYTDDLYDEDRVNRNWNLIDTIDNPSGLRASLYERNGEKVLAFAGTEPALNDVRADILQGWLGSDEQYTEAINLTGRMVALHGPNIHLVGHSLGGGLASAAALVHRLRATTFNAAGVNPRTLEPFQATTDGHETLIDAFRVRGEILSTLQDTNQLTSVSAAWLGPAAFLMGSFGSIMPDSVGRAYYLSSNVIDPFSRHSRPAYLEALFDA